MLVPVRGVLVVEDEQTGDGRYIGPGVLTWAPLPLPIAYITGGDQHVDLVTAGPQVGVIQTITREGSNVAFTGVLDDEIPEAAELVRRMNAGSAAHGNQQFLSIDPDDWALQVIDTTVEITGGGDDEAPEPVEPEARVRATLSGRGSLPPLGLVAAAGDGAPSGEIVFEDAADMWVQSFTRMRIRGVTGCSVPAFAGAYMELAGEAPAEEPTDEAPAEEAPSETASAIRLPSSGVVNGVPFHARDRIYMNSGGAVSVVAATPMRPPRDWFFEPEPDVDDERMVEQYDAEGNYIGLACPFTILDSGQWFGHLAAGWGQCHTGYQTCVNPPSSPTSYAHFHIGEAPCEGGERVPAGAFVVGCDHAAAHMMASDARDHYAHAGLMWGQGRVTNGDHAPWGCGALMPGIDEATLRVIRATTLSGDWRRIGGALELIVGLSVGGPGFPVAREALAASAISHLADSKPETFFANGVQTSLVAAAGAARCKDCQERMTLRVNVQPEFDATVGKMIERRTRHLIPDARDAMLAKIRGK